MGGDVSHAFFLFSCLSLLSPGIRSTELVVLDSSERSSRSEEFHLFFCCYHKRQARRLWDMGQKSGFWAATALHCEMADGPGVLKYRLRLFLQRIITLDCAMNQRKNSCSRNT